MPRKPRKGYFVRGEFVAEGSELDLELKRELKGGDAPSRTELKRESTALQALGEELLELSASRLSALMLPERLVESMAEARRITNFEGRRRQMQFVGKLMRLLDADTVEKVRAAIEAQHGGSAKEAQALHRAEQWRDALIDDPEALERWLTQFPATDTQQLRTLVRQARKDAQPAQPGASLRHGRAYREIFQLVRSALEAETPPALS